MVRASGKRTSRAQQAHRGAACAVASCLSVCRDEWVVMHRNNTSNAGKRPLFYLAQPGFHSRHDEKQFVLAAQHKKWINDDEFLWEAQESLFASVDTLFTMSAMKGQHRGRLVLFFVLITPHDFFIHNLYVYVQHFIQPILPAPHLSPYPNSVPQSNQTFYLHLNATIQFRNQKNSKEMRHICSINLNIIRGFDFLD